MERENISTIISGHAVLCCTAVYSYIAYIVHQYDVRQWADDGGVITWWK